MKTRVIFIAFCLAFGPACKAQQSETSKWVLDSMNGSSGTYISESHYGAGTILNLQIKDIGKLSAVIIAKVPETPQDYEPRNWIGALGPAGPRYNVEFKGVSNVRVRSMNRRA